MQITDISWCTYSWNPVTGCTPCGPECENCYAERFMRRQAKRDDAPAYMSEKAWARENEHEVVTCHSDRLDQPLEYTYPEGAGKVFVVSFGDLFHRCVSDSFIQSVVETARECPAQEFVFLTKRPGRAAQIEIDWPANAIVGTSVGSGPGGEEPDTTHRIDQLRGVDARRWISFEPLIEPVGDIDLSGIDWVVIGGETGPADERREMEHAWAKHVFEQARAADIPVYYKQDSGAKPGENPYLSIQDPETGVFKQRQIREHPAVPEMTQRARQKKSAGKS